MESRKNVPNEIKIQKMEKIPLIQLYTVSIIFTNINYYDIDLIEFKGILLV